MSAARKGSPSPTRGAGSPASGPHPDDLPRSGEKTCPTARCVLYDGHPLDHQDKAGRRWLGPGEVLTVPGDEQPAGSDDPDRAGRSLVDQAERAIASAIEGLVDQYPPAAHAALMHAARIALGNAPERWRRG